MCVDQFLPKTGTTTTLENTHNTQVMKFNVRFVITFTVEAKNPADLPKWLRGRGSWPSRTPQSGASLSRVSWDPTIAGACELHLEICLKNPEKDHTRTPIKKSDAESKVRFLSKSPNQHIPLYMKVRPFRDHLAEDSNQGEVWAHH